ncbi:uncharacterized protein HMPREF1541_10344 [Cyphellophora europaea CBS 101466]|uniref:Amine oxidase n=1 Tax=Cyphellophora europaea (strain CBS 101466) TaxID=1220924 RepID=W2S9S3_CYPE1|nr:uncharacterized protein HMPREF1541_10344 [Cyphellophora europaea CBS 101466]ETN44674.1 hypothetical protein HMPREF1541_10344 [Cyphellophora europaea CBS 101466]
MSPLLRTRPLTSLLLLATHQCLLPSRVFVNGAALPADENGWTSVERPEPPVEVDVVVVGGGYSGLTSAYELHQAGLSTVVLEAKDRIGGRSRSHQRESGPGIVELGATWINNSTQPAIWELTQHFGLETLVQYTEGDEVLQSPDGQVVRVPPATGEEEESPEPEDIVAALINEAVEEVDIRQFADFPEDQDVSVADWIALNGLWNESGIPELLSQMTTTIVGREPNETGAHYFFDYIKSGYGLESLGTETEFGAQFLMLAEGTTALARKLADAMTPGSVLTDAAVTEISQDDDTAIVTIKTGKKFKAKKVIVAIPTNTYSDIKFTPSLPSEKAQIVSNTMPGIYAKMILSYTEPWWREAGLVGKFTSLVGPIRFSWDTSNPALSQYSLAVFIAGDVATEWHALPDEERQQTMIEHLAELVGEDLADYALDVLEVNYVEWTKEEYIWGGPTSAMAPGMLRQYGTALRESFANLHFGGGETAYEWKGYLEGAITAGQRAAEEVVEALGSGGKA